MVCVCVYMTGVGLLWFIFLFRCLAIPRFRMNSDTVLTLSCFYIHGTACGWTAALISGSQVNDSIKNVFIGKIIQQKVDEKGISYAEFARRINCARTSLYYLFNSKSIDVERLMLVSEVLEYDFLSHVYMVGDNVKGCDGAFIQLPFKEGKIDMSHLPKEIIKILKEYLDDNGEL